MQDLRHGSVLMCVGYAIIIIINKLLIAFTVKLHVTMVNVNAI